MLIMQLSWSMIRNPVQSFLNINRGQFTAQVHKAFLLAALITFTKSFFKDRVVYNFYENDLLNIFFSIISIPQVIWALSYISFLLFIHLLHLFSRFISNNKLKRKALFQVFMSFSIYGVFLHAIFTITNFLFSNDFNRLLVYICFIGIIILSCLALTKAGEISFFKSILLFILSAIPITFLAGITGIFPFLMWLRI